MSIIAKKAAGYQAAELVKENMRIGLGTGSTAFFFVERLAQRCKEGLSIRAVASSKAVEAQALRLGIPLIEEGRWDCLDLAVDGADAVNVHWHLIKGGGGALLREKILAASATAFMVIIDESKWVETMVGQKLPLEVAPFGLTSTQYRLEREGFFPIVRPVLSDNGNYLIDVICPSDDVAAVDHKLKKISGVLETGLFLGFTSTLIVGMHNGNVQIY